MHPEIRVNRSLSSNLECREEPKNQQTHSHKEQQSRDSREEVEIGSQKNQILEFHPAQLTIICKQILSERKNIHPTIFELDKKLRGEEAKVEHLVMLQKYLSIGEEQQEVWTKLIDSYYTKRKIVHACKMVGSSCITLMKEWIQKNIFECYQNLSQAQKQCFQAAKVQQHQ